MRSIILILFSLLACVACQPPVTSAGAMTTDSRQVTLPDVTLSYSPALLQTEMPVTLTAEFPADWRIIKAQLVGLSMDMLTIPLFFQPITAEAKAADASKGQPVQTMQWQTQMLFGACADRQMHWQLELTFVDAGGGQHKRHDELVVTRR